MTMLKTPAQIQAIREAVQVTEAAFTRIVAVLKESAIVGDLVYYRGAVLTSEYLHTVTAEHFAANDYITPEGMIISSGHDAAEPHHVGAGQIRPHTAIVVDLFPQSKKTGFYADITRTYVKGEPIPKLAAMYEAVLSAHHIALAMVVPGMVAKDLHSAAVRIFIEAGFDVTKEKGFVHSLGHGLGTAVHEAPKINQTSQTLLEAGMIITIEPGLYYKDIGGIRIEDTVLVTNAGCECLSVLPYLWLC